MTPGRQGIAFGAGTLVSSYFMPDASEPKSEHLGERYALYGEIASGGMATVHFGRLRGAIGFSRTVAIKRLNAQFVHEPEFVRMFVDEARLAARVRHPNVVATIDVVASENLLYLVMEYVQGESLAKLARACVAQGGRVPRRIATAIMLGILQGLHAAHEAKNERGEPLGIVHRDVSPQNVLVGTDGVARVIDFGIAKAAARTQASTDVGQMKGKPAYMSPEQIFDKDVTRLTDIYAASVVYWELLTGERLFLGKNDIDTINRVLKHKVEAPSSRVPSLLPAIDEIVLRGLERDPSKRFATARDMARALEDCIAPASASDVGEWVEKLAGEVLALRERRLKEIEDRTQMPPSEPPRRDTPQDTAVFPANRPEQAATAASSPALVARDLATVPGFFPVGPTVAEPWQPSIPQATPFSQPKVAIEAKAEADRLSIPTPMNAQFVPLPLKRPAHLDFEADTTVEPPHFDFDTESRNDTIANPVPVPVVDVVVGPRVVVVPPPSAPAAVSVPAARPAKRKSWLGAALVTGAVLGLGFAGLHELPRLLLARCVAAAERQGVTLSAQSAGLHGLTFVLHGVKLSVPALPFVTATATEVDIDGLHSSRVEAADFELKVTGAVDDVGDRLSAWRSKPGTDTYEVTARSGHVVWAKPFGEGTQVEASDAHLTLDARGSGRDSFAITAPTVTVHTPHASLGPWGAELNRDALASRVKVMLDPAYPTWATAELSMAAQGGSTVAVAIPRSPLARLGLPRDLFGGAFDVSTQLEAKVDVATTTSTDGAANLALYGLKGSRGPTDARLDAKLAGAPDAWVVDGSLAAGDRKGKLNGTIAKPGLASRLSLAWKLGSALCEPDAHRPPSPVVVTFDLVGLDLGAATVAVSPDHCLVGSLLP